MFDEEIKNIKLVRREQFGNDRSNVQQLPLIAAEIEARLVSTKRNMFEIGRLLTKAKRLLPQGKFQSWVKNNCDFSYQTANNFMNVYKYCLKQPDLVNTIKGSVLYKIASHKFPSDLRKHLFQHGEYLKDIKYKQIKEIMKRYHDQEINLKSPEILNLIDFKKNKRKNKRYQIKIKQNIMLLKKLQANATGMAGKIEWPIPPNKDKTELNSDQKRMIKNIIEHILSTVNGAMPDFITNDDMKPKLKIA